MSALEIGVREVTVDHDAPPSNPDACLNCGCPDAHVFTTTPEEPETGYSEQGYVCEHCGCSDPAYLDSDGGDA